MSIVIIGMIKRPDTLDENGEVLEVGVTLEGFHVDSLEKLDGADKYLVNPSSPVHGFYGVKHCYKYTFESEEQFYELFPKEETIGELE